MTLTEKSAYIKGLTEGLELDKTTKEGKIILALLDLVDEMAGDIADLQNDISEIDDDMDYLNEYIEEIDEDLQAVEDFLDEECELDEVDLDEDLDDEYFDEDDLDEEFFELDCPSCGETVCFDQDLDPENLICPACGEKFDCTVEDDDLKKVED